MLNLKAVYQVERNGGSAINHTVVNKTHTHTLFI